MPLPLRRGEYFSPFFLTNIDAVYQIDLYFLPWDRSPLKVDWKIVDTYGRISQRGTYKDQQHGGNGAVLGHYHANMGDRQRIVVTVLDDVTGIDTHPRLRVGLPDLGLDYTEGYLPFALLWAAGCVGVGVIALLTLLMLRSFRPQGPVTT